MTLKKARLRAKLMIENDHPDIYDVAADVGQIVDNVKHMKWFRDAVAIYIMGHDHGD